MSVLADPSRVLASAEPYPYVVTSQVFDPHEAETLLSWLESTKTWTYSPTVFSEHWRFILAPDKHAEAPAEVRSILSQDMLRAMRQRMEVMFNVRLRPHVAVICHWMERGHGIGVHDDQVAGSETHRLTMTLRRGPYTDADGGHFVFLNSFDRFDVHRLVRPLHNSAVAFEAATPHAVTDVQAGDRYSLVFEFCDADQPLPRPEDDHRAAIRLAC